MLKKIILYSVLSIAFFTALCQVTSAQVKKDTSVQLINPIGGTEANPIGVADTRVIFGGAIKVTLGFLGTFTLLVFFYGGFLWLTSAGNSDKVKKGGETMLYAVVGLFIIFGAYGILNTIISGVRGTASDDQPLLEENKDVFGPENDPNAPKDFNCQSLDNQACHKAQSKKCTWVTYFIPNSGGNAYTACANNEKKETTCAQFNNDCKSNGIDEASCNKQLEACML